ncbi:MAG: class I SAM-dependent methyltransferase, partial [Acidimicrobiia bacterium]
PEPSPDVDRARQLYREHASHYDRRIKYLNPLRRRVIGKLQLRDGDHVLDMGSGTGASFDVLRDAVGSSGRVTGVELSEEMAAVARKRIDDHGWTNVEVIVGDASTVPLPTDVDGVLFFLVHDLTRTTEVVQRAVASGRPGARVVALGPVSAPRWAIPVNVIGRTIARRYITTFEGFDAPWTHLAVELPGLRVRRILGGGVYVATGTVSHSSDVAR